MLTSVRSTFPLVAAIVAVLVSSDHVAALDCSQGNGTLQEWGRCDEEPTGCASCNQEGKPMACYRQDEYYSQCLVVGTCPDNGLWECSATFNDGSTEAAPKEPLSAIFNTTVASTEMLESSAPFHTSMSGTTAVVTGSARMTTPEPKGPIMCNADYQLNEWAACTLPSNGCCDSDQGLTCYRQNADYAQCLKTGSCQSLYPSWECTEFDRMADMCSEGDGTLEQWADCSDEPTGCASCNKQGQEMACYKQNDFYSQCLVVGSCPNSNMWDCGATWNSGKTAPGRGVIDTTMESLSVLFNTTVASGELLESAAPFDTSPFQTRPTPAPSAEGFQVVVETMLSGVTQEEFENNVESFKQVVADNLPGTEPDDVIIMSVTEVDVRRAGYRRLLATAVEVRYRVVGFESAEEAEEAAEMVQESVEEIHNGLVESGFENLESIEVLSVASAPVVEDTPVDTPSATPQAEITPAPAGKPITQTAGFIAGMCALAVGVVMLACGAWLLRRRRQQHEPAFDSRAKHYHAMSEEVEAPPPGQPTTAPSSDERLEQGDSGRQRKVQSGLVLGKQAQNATDLPRTSTGSEVQRTDLENTLLDVWDGETTEIPQQAAPVRKGSQVATGHPVHMEGNQPGVLSFESGDWTPDPMDVEACLVFHKEGPQEAPSELDLTSPKHTAVHIDNNGIPGPITPAAAARRGEISLMPTHAPEQATLDPFWLENDGAADDLRQANGLYPSMSSQQPRGAENA